ncbi:hypothetical protein ABC347_06765 [Sphingomonas sp. 1P06PA]|uniref:hypothetical protein n=1 Tax=Sphingomonas sp. 1P06PA TaxID=554121 RepID=UPI0039A4DA5F
MPFRRAPYAIALLFAVTILAFWPGYFGRLAASPLAFHFHGITASLWLVMLAAQSATIHGGRRDLHRAIGLSSLALFPLLLGGSAAVLHSMAVATASGTDPFYNIYGARLAIIDASSIPLLGWLYFNAIRDRRSVQRHARFLMATPLPLLMPIVGRLLNHHVPGLIIMGPQDFGLFAIGLRLSSLFAIAVAGWLYASDPRHGRPFLVAGIVIAGQTIAFDTIGHVAGWQQLVVALGRLPSLPIILAVVGIGIAISWLAWVAGGSTMQRRAART